MLLRLTSINVTTQPYIWGQTGNLDANAGGAAGVAQCVLGY